MNEALRAGEPAAALEPVTSAALRPVEALWATILAHAPALLSAIGLLLAMWLVARVIRSVVARVLGMTRLDALTEKTQLGKLLRAFDGAMTMSRAIASLAYFTILLMAFMSAADLLGLTTLSEALAGALAYLPRVVSVLLVLAAGGFVANAARRAVGAMLKEMRSPYAGPVEAATEIAIMVIVIAIAVDLLGVDISFITANLSLIVGVLLVTMAFLFAWSMRRPAEEIIANYYLRRLVNPGDRVTLGDVEGTVEGFVGIGVVLRDAKGAERFIPARHVLDGLTCAARARRGASARGGER
ncbi:MAG: hypothetical protein H6711_08160 [Myxococcales bacterium]|nr:hypothetical protein [Myxococcales bacterium]